jgi:hypothetical protein
MNHPKYMNDLWNMNQQTCMIHKIYESTKIYEWSIKSEWCKIYESTKTYEWSMKYEWSIKYMNQQKIYESTKYMNDP